MRKTQKAIIVVDAYGPARVFREYIKSAGLVCFYIQGTSRSLPRLKLMGLEKYDYCITHEGGLKETIGEILGACESLRVKLLEIIAGIEPGVLLADQLSSHFEFRYKRYW